MDEWKILMPKCLNNKQLVPLNFALLQIALLRKLNGFATLNTSGRLDALRFFSIIPLVCSTKMSRIETLEIYLRKIDRPEHHQADELGYNNLIRLF